MKSQVYLSIGSIFEAIFYCSITIYSPSIEKRFLDNQFVSSANDNDFAWCSKCGGGGSGLKFIFHLKHKKGCIFNPSLSHLELNNVLVHVDGYVTPFVPIFTLMEKILPIKQKLYRLVGSYCIISFILFYYEWYCLCLCMIF